MDSEYILRMRFRTSGGGDRLHTITLNEATLNADDDAGPVMDTIIADNIFDTSTGDLTAKHSVVLSIRDYAEIDITI